MAEVARETFAPLTVETRPQPTTRFEHALHDLLDDLFLVYPTWATEIGYHAYDDRWPDLTDAGRLSRLATLRRHRDVLEELAEDALSGDERIDRGILLEALDGLIFEEEVLRERAWDPMSVVRLLGDGLFALLGREYAPFTHRGAAFLFRMRRLREALEAASEALAGLPDRPVSALHTDTAIGQLAGIDELIDEAIVEAGRRREAGEDEGLEQRLREEAPAAKEALAAFRRFLEEEVRPRASGEGRLGPELFQQKLRHTLASDLSYDEIVARARHDYELVRSEIFRLSRELWPTWLGEEALPHAGDGRSEGEVDEEIARRVLDAINREHRRPDELLEYCRREVARIEAFCREHSVIGLPDEPLTITWTPTFLRPLGGAWLSPPGPLDKGLRSYFWITPPGEDWPAERVESFLREDNDRMLRLISIHEAIPGHYLQLAWSNRCPSLTRGVFASGTFAEGWAVYVTQVMMDLGYAEDDRALWLVHWKLYLRAIINAILDVSLHTGDMTEEEAMELMVRGGFQEEQEARAKWLRARLTSTQLSTYYVGSLEMWDLELEARRRTQAAGGAEAALPAPRVVGGLGDTPGFEYRGHLESVISHGTPPTKWLRRILSIGPAS